MTSQILTRGQLEKMSNENLIASFSALQDNIILLQNYLFQQNRDISKKLLEIVPKIDRRSTNHVNKLTCHVSVAQNASKVLQEAFSTTSSKLVELERQNHKLEQYSRREYFDFSGIPGSAALKDLESFILHILQKIGIDLDESRIAACHGLGKTEQSSSS